MKIFLTLIIGIGLGAGLFWFISTHQYGSVHTARSGADTLETKLRTLDLLPQNVKEDLAQTGKVVRRKAREAGAAIADATLDSRITAAIKGKLVTSRDLSALRISVNTTAGVVTLSGLVSAPDDISKAVLLAMETDGVREVISTLQVRPAAKQ